MGPVESSPPQPALATTKRKFYKLLDNVTAGASTTSLASTLRESNVSNTSLAAPATPETASKRSRLSMEAAEQQRIVSGSDRIKALQDRLFTPGKTLDRPVVGTVRAVGAKAAVPQPSTPRKEPYYQPYSQEQFLGRLKTFADVRKWTNKPDAIGEVQWAKRGWSCDIWNAVACKGGCEQRVVVKLRPKRKDNEGKEIKMTEDMALETDEGLVEKYRELIVDGHAEDCLWRRRGCTDDIYHIPIPNRAKSSQELLDRYHSFKAMADDLPISEDLIYPDPSSSEVLERISPLFFRSPGSPPDESPPSTPAEISAFTFALFGWSGVSESKIALATCGHCFQRVGLWLYKSDRLKEMSTKLEVPIESLRLNLLESHREHCPWKNPVTQGNPKDGSIKNMAAWQTLEFLLMGRRKLAEKKHVQDESVDLSSYRGSIDSEQHFSVSATDRSRDSKDADSLNEKWKRFKAKLRRTTSRKSLKSTKSVKSVKSTKSGKSMGEKEDKENAGSND
ncbi:zf-C3HC-domain-containing protein [Lophiostoma macrostomum CBS 122681]|uniref:Zf-C3HC-domain-containing protein n=1 Tax=Lophiostoma macrostomum CBS 122681 TaxID=1314788 RepID=A0A6A6TDY6_9PLEO|nr:zf-C3HC-domain-containing protein [Lophiostoma macrostomum CBS 122681]